jgi:hypothetical protein
MPGRTWFTAVTEPYRENSTAAARSATVVSSTGRRNSCCGMGLYWRISIGPSSWLAWSSAEVRAVVSLTLAAYPRAERPWLVRFEARASRCSWLREIRAMS